jgi:hypothetical protein
MEEDETDWTCSTHVINDMFKNYLPGNLERRGHLQNLCVCGKVILRIR